MTHKSRAAAALHAAVIGISLLGLSLPRLRADSTWIDPSDPTGVGNDPSAGIHLNGTYETAGHWNPSGIPGSTANVQFNAPGYPTTAYTVTFTQDQQANKAVIDNIVTLDLQSHTFSLNSFNNSFNDVSLLAADEKQLLVIRGTVQTQNVQIGSATSETLGSTTLTSDGSDALGLLQVADGSTVANYQTLRATNGGTIQFGDNVVLNQSPDLASGGFNTALTSIEGASALLLGDNDTVRGGILRSFNGGTIGALGTSLTYDSLYYDADLFLDGEAFTLNLASTLLDPHKGNALIPVTITGVVNVDELAVVNINNAIVQVTPDSGTTFNSFTIVGNSSLNIFNSVLNIGLLNLDGDGAPGTGTHTVIDFSAVAASGDLVVGYLGNADVLVSGGSAINVAGSATIGNWEGSSGSLTLTGLGTVLTTGVSDFDAQNGLIVGRSGSGQFTISNGALAVTSAAAPNANIGVEDNGDNTFGSGTLTVTGAAIDSLNQTVQSTLDLTRNGSGELHVGSSNHTQGVVMITNGGLVFDSNAYIAENGGSTGSVTVDGGFFNAIANVTAVSQWENSGSVTIGVVGSGALTADHGAVVDTGGSLIVAHTQGAAGAVTVSNYSLLNVALVDPDGILSLGRNGAGSLTINSGGAVYVSTYSYIGDNASGVGVASVGGQDSTFATSLELVVGNLGTGSLTISDHAVVSDFVGRIGEFVGSHGTVLIDHATWTHVSFLEVADSGIAHLTIQNQGVLSVFDINMSFFANSFSFLTVDNAFIANNGFLTVGNGGIATLQILNGGSVTNTDANIGFESTSLASVTVDGPGSHWTNSGFLQVGGTGVGSLTISHGGAVTTTFASIARDLGSSGRIIIDGSGSSLTSTGVLFVGNGGNGILSVQNHGLASNAENALVGILEGSSGGALVTGGSKWLNAKQLIIGADGTGNVSIASNSLVTASGETSGSRSAVIVGEESNALGFLNISDPGSKLQLVDHLVIGFGNNGAGIGNGGNGTLGVFNGGLITDLNGYVGRYAGSLGDATVAGNGSAWQNAGSFYIAANDSANNPSGQTLLAGTGTVTIGIGGSVSAMTSAVIGAAGVLNMQGGMFTSPTISLNGALKGNGSVFGPIAGAGSVEADSPGPLTTDSLRVNSLTITANAAHVLRPNSAYSKINSLAIAHTAAGSSATYSGALQLNNNRLILQSSDPTDKAAKILQINEALFAGHNGTTNTWSSIKGITSSTVAADPTHLTIGIYDNAALHSLSSSGQPRTDWAGGTNNVDPNSLLITPALKGDANLDGLIDIADMIVIANNWNKSGLSNGISTIDMAHGDVNQDGIVDIADMVVIANNWNQTSPFNLDAALSQFPMTNPQLPTNIPEPSSLALLLLTSPLLLRRPTSNSRKKLLPIPQ